MYHGIVSGSAMCRFRFEKNIVHDQGFGARKLRVCVWLSCPPALYECSCRDAPVRAYYLIEAGLYGHKSLRPEALFQ